MTVKKRDIRALSKEELRDFFVSIGDKAFRGTQVYEWLWSKGSHGFKEMTNLSKETRAHLDENFVINHIKVDQIQKSVDGTIKNAVKLYDDLVVESVLIPSIISASYSLYIDVKYSTNFVALPTHITSTPVASGSSVPVCPTFFVFNSLDTILTISLLV